jgi:hypothetical protein
MCIEMVLINLNETEIFSFRIALSFDSSLNRIRCIYELGCTLENGLGSKNRN